MAANDVTQLKRQFGELTGLDPSLLAQAALDGFVRRRCQALGISGEAAYYARAIQDADETDRLVHEVSVAETWFFRYPPSFEVLKSHAAELLRQRRNQLRMLSIACATGEEPYSMAMAAAEAGWPLERIAIDAVDRYEASLQLARKGVYRPNSLRGEIPAWAQSWINSTASETRVDPRIVATVRFACRDVVGDSLPADKSSYDVVCCRNLFIYLSAAARKKLIDYLLAATTEGGLLLVGHAEVGIIPPGPFVAAGVSQAFALRRTATTSLSAGAPAPSQVGAAPVQAPARQAQQIADTVQRPQPSPASRTESNPRAAITLEEARALADAGQLDRARTALDEISTQLPANPDVYSLLGSIELSTGRLAKAEDAFQKVLYIDPHHETALLQLAIVCDRLGHGEQAARFRRRAARAHENSPAEPPSEAS